MKSIPLLLSIVILCLRFDSASQSHKESFEIPGPIDPGSSEGVMRTFIERYSADLGSLHRSFPVEISPTRRDRLRSFHTKWLLGLEEMSFESLSEGDRVDHVLFKNHLNREIRELDLRRKRVEEMLPLISFAATIIQMEEARRWFEPVDGESSAAILDNIPGLIDATRQAVEAGLEPGEATRNNKGAKATSVIRTTKSVAYRAAGEIKRLREALKEWFRFYAGYDPMFTWWVEVPFKKADKALDDYSTFLREKVVGVKGNEKDAIIGDPIGREALISALTFEMIPYSPEELVEIAEKEFVWCEAEMKKASRELGYGEEWRKALEHVKTLHVEPGKQPALIRDLAQEAVKFLEDRDLLTIPALARESWRMEMMSPERQRVSPFFTGGEVISVSYPVDTMQHDQKMMSMRGNNIHFSRATVHHELIPGHHLQGFMTERYRPYRGLFWTPFWGEGWALYWEMQLWDLAFARSPEDRIGMLFWRMHRCARIVFSFNFHLGKMTPQECIDLLVQRVGHEVDNATAEVRRSFGGDYSPLYQAAYLLGGLQFRALHRELVESGKMTDGEFHDAILQENAIPVEILRAALTDQPITADFKSSWRFYQPDR